MNEEDMPRPSLSRRTNSFESVMQVLQIPVWMKAAAMAVAVLLAVLFGYLMGTLHSWDPHSIEPGQRMTMSPVTNYIHQIPPDKTLQAQAQQVKAMQQKQQKEAEWRYREGGRYWQQQPWIESVSDRWPAIETLPLGQQMRILVTGGAGFVGSHLVDRLMRAGHEVIVLDNMFTGRKRNVATWFGHPNFQLKEGDVVEPIMLEVDQIYHLACPASPPHYQFNPIKTIKVSTQGTLNMLGLAKRVGARILLTSTSEVYGDPKENPQKETYWGNVNPIGPRACYDEGKRVAETMMYAYQRQAGVDVRVARIFNTFGPRMHPNDGRVVSNFIIQALQGKDITVYGEGSQTRSFQYVDDLVEGLIRLMNSDYSDPVNLGNPDEYSIVKFAHSIVAITNSSSQVVHLPATQDDPHQRKPDIGVAKKELQWHPVWQVKDGLSETVEYFKQELMRTGEITPTGPNPSKPRGRASKPPRKGYT
uniref:UDP-glucuronate decarboxylase n=1 Tax=Fibrocapsa japonica TaxID=94617 RepID=A0A7S2UT44_9STRA|mmetsp:Transcript_12105/g.17846  ORF Transcript_12105/g.17846 Transcript_12105/m.17846 type:complete len:475 (+) Transcript_12105:30-1454(+)